MLKEDCERIGVLECGAAFQKIGFMFREQPIGDYGIDAIIETRDDKYLSVSVVPGSPDKVCTTGRIVSATI